MAIAFVLSALLIVASASFFIRIERRASESKGDTQVQIVMMKLRRPPTLLCLCILVLPVQAEDISDSDPSEPNNSPLVSDLSVDQFSEVVKMIVQQTLAECAVEGNMEGKAKVNLDVTGDVTARIVCQTNTNTERK